MNHARVLPNTVGNVKSGDPQIVVMSIRQRIKGWGPHLVLVSDTGRVHVRRACDCRCELMLRQYPEMVVGYFDHRMDGDHLKESMLSVYEDQQPKKVAA